MTVEKCYLGNRVDPLPNRRKNMTHPSIYIRTYLLAQNKIKRSTCTHENVTMKLTTSYNWYALIIIKRKRRGGWERGGEEFELFYTTLLNNWTCSAVSQNQIGNYQVKILLIEPVAEFHILATVNSTTINLRMQISLRCAGFGSFEYIPRSSITGSYGSSSFSFFRVSLDTLPRINR